MFRKLIALAALGNVAAAAFAVITFDVQETIALQDGTTVYVFKDGKMSIEDKLGRDVRMQPGHVMAAKGGRRIVMGGDEFARLDTVRRARRNGGL